MKAEKLIKSLSETGSDGSCDRISIRTPYPDNSGIARSVQVNTDNGRSMFSFPEIFFTLIS